MDHLYLVPHLMVHNSLPGPTPNGLPTLYLVLHLTDHLYLVLYLTDHLYVVLYLTDHLYLVLQFNLIEVCGEVNGSKSEGR